MLRRAAVRFPTPQLRSLKHGVRGHLGPRQAFRQAHSSAPTVNRPRAAFFAGGLLIGSLLTYFAGSSRSSSVSPAKASSVKRESDLEVVEYASNAEVKEALDKIRKIVGDDNVETQKELLEVHADSSWQTRHPKPEEVPAAVVLPSSTEQVSEIMKIANAYLVPVTAYGGGTSLEGHITPVYGGISLDMSKMNKVIAIHESDLDATVQPTVGWEELNGQLKQYGLMFGTDAGPGATIGGMVNTGASGMNAFFYGPMRHNVINLTVVLADGTIIKTKRRPRKTSAGYSLNELFVGSEGTLGIVTEITLKLAPIPSFTRVALVTFPKISDATDTVTDMLLHNLPLSAIELLNDKQMKIINDSDATERKWDEHHSLLLRFAGATEDSVLSCIEKVKELAAKHNSLNVELAKTKDESADLWSARKCALWSFMGAFPGRDVWTTDVAVPLSKLSQIIEESNQYVEDADVVATVIGHVGDGNFHLILAYDSDQSKKATEDVADKLARRAIELDGTCTGEHGIGAGKRHYLREEVGPETIAFMRQIKAAVDPNTILNPGKVFSTSKHDCSDHN